MANDTTTNTFEPWGPQGEGIQYGWGKGRNLFDRDFGAAYDPFSATSKAALAAHRGIAAGGNPFLAPATDAVTGVASGQNSITTGGMFGDVYDDLSSGMYGDVGSGSMLNSNPYREAALNDALDQTQARIKASMSGAGRLGSDFYGEGMARGLGGVATEFRNAGYESDMDRMMRAREAAAANKLSAASGLTGVQGQNIANRLTAAGMAPAMSDFRYADAREMAKAGAAEDSMAQARRDQDWGTLSKYLGMFGGVPGSAGTSTTTGPGTSDWLKILGGGATGAGLGSMFGPLGAGLGGLLGAGGSLIDSIFS